MTRKLIIIFLVFCIPAFITGCGGKKEEPSSPEIESPQPEESSESEATALAKEILATFDKAVSETAELLKDKPETADVKPRFESLIEKYAETMAGLNVKYLALRDKDIALFGECNGYLGENRGKHVFQKDQSLGEFIAYYNFQKNEKDFSENISKELINLLEIAIKH